MHFLVSKSFHLLLVFSSLLLFFQPAIFSNEDPVIDLIDFSVCSDATLNYTSGSQFETNLDRLLPKLSPDGPIDINGYYNTTHGEDPNIVYGYSQCMSGATEEECRACLKNSTVEIIRSCPNRKQGIIRYYRCILRYSYQPFFAQSQIGIKEVAHRDQNASDPAVFNQQLGDLMRDLTSQASSKPSRYATGTVDLNSFDNINGLAQCTRDLSTTDCTGCLRAMIGSIPSCCANRTGGIAFSVSCNIRYETYPFFNGFPETPPPSPLPLPASPPPSRGTDTSVGDGNGEKKKKKKNSRTVVIAVVTVVVAVGVITSICACLWMRRKAKRRTPALEAREGQEQIPIMKMESMLFDFSTLEAATANFSDENKLGQGGFGPVYKGKLFDGRDIAVKRLSRTSVQGMEELRNEVELVAKLQHRNLVRLWGCCLEHHEKLLVYEYVPNTSLDRFLFDPIKRLQLKWDTRYNIIRGIARGLLYLHEDSLLRIIHRDLKASNILLDGDMNPKIADFGLARLFGADQTEDNTSRIAGTYGYMSPEYLAFGNFSTKSDVFSFGVLVLEIVTGRKSTSFHNSEGKMNLQTYVWQHWTEETVLEIMDQTIAEECSTSEVFRCIHMGLLCMEEEASVRPTMSMVVLMLNSQSLSLPSPSLPAYLVGESRFGSTSVSTSSNSTRSRSK